MPLMILGLAMITLAFPVDGPAGAFLGVGGICLVWSGYFGRKSGGDR